ncbi:MAG: 5-oxoprolinase subunit PxpB [Armatimonadota bacterium]|nr:5-oxoprolinase subunit PxpB [Armatimonadota bacterium]MDR7444230.1 5-oxoprolinase subunit PxpB [Armatimonadota bacterium]MDR7570522.1 5-oxoprolinase subunit PxpB [Armatimonadota bacterium]MDR7614235.1 5-oxoprolinase subunit PxpB [Armatimonadota bacterium]
MRLVPFGRGAVLVDLGEEISPRMLARVLSVDRVLQGVPGVRETVPAYGSVLAFFEKSADVQAVEKALAGQMGEPEPLPGDRVREIPVAYGGVHGPDLDRVAAWAGLSPEEVVELHCGTEYLVYMLGFAPGFPYMATVPDRIAAPRLPRPRTVVPSGSVGVAGRLTGIYPAPTAGGWNLLGRTPLLIFDPTRSPPALLEVGDRVRFSPIPQEEFREPSLPPMPPLGHRPAIAVLRGGLCTTVQDLGRYGYRRYGVPPSGAMDPEALRAANESVGNPPEAAGLEFTWPGPVLEALVDLVVAVGGADFAPEVGGSPVPLNRPVRWRRGEVVRFRGRRRGMWAYLAVGGGIRVPPVLGSRSTHVRARLGGLEGRPLRTGDVLPVGHGLGVGTPPSSEPTRGPVRVLPGPHLGAFAAGAFERFVASAYTVSAHSDRSGYRLEGPRIPHAGPGEILSQGMLPGAVQVPPDGQPIVLMRDGPTTGGYPVLAVIPEEELGRFAQYGPGEVVRFTPG